MRFWIEETPGGRTGGIESSQAAKLDGASTIDADTDVRCRRCHRVLTSARSIEAGVGWRCRARLAEAVIV